MSLDRRRFLQNSSLAATGLAAAGRASRAAQPAAAAEATHFASNWHRLPDRVWIGPEFWANPLQDWRVAGGRLESVNPARNRNVHLLTRDLDAAAGECTLRVTLGRVGGKLGAGKGSAGFRVGIQGPLKEYRNNIVFGSGLDCGVASDGRLFIGGPNAQATEIDLGRESITLTLKVSKSGAGEKVVLEASSGKVLLGKVERTLKTPLAGNIALVSNFGPTRVRGNQNTPYAKIGTGKFWFRDLVVDGPKLGVHDDRAYGPVMFTQYTLHGGVMTMTAQMPPVGEEDDPLVFLGVEKGDGARVVSAKIDPDARTATFRVKDWDASRDVPYRVVFKQNYTDGETEQFTYAGTIRKEPTGDVLTVADVSCNIHFAFPNHEFTANVAKADPDLITFVGDQFYESTGGYGVTRQPIEPAILDLLHKWYIHGWTWRELTKDRPSIAIPDDHDVYQGNIWGEAGAGKQKTQESGGYGMPVRWVNVVHRTQTSHHPAPHDPTPLERGISVYYGPMTYGGVSFAILADRMFKTGPEGVVPPTNGRGDHVTDPNFDPKTADVEGAVLLGDRQLAFLKEWAEDWTDAEMKAVVSQTIFTAMATHHGPGHQRLIADYDANGWPQTGRRKALEIIRTCHAVHLAGDQHLPAVVQYGLDEHRDAAVAFAGPAVNVGYPRWWEPEQKGGGEKRAGLEHTGDYTDSFGNRLTVLAYKNGALAPKGPVLEYLEQRASGIGLVRFDKSKRTIMFECWPFRADPTTDEQMPGWPVQVSVADNGPTSKTSTAAVEFEAPPEGSRYVARVERMDGELLYSVPVRGTTFSADVPEPGDYRVVLVDESRQVVDSIVTRAT